MITIISMSMIVHPTKAIVEKMCRYNENDSREEQPRFVMNKKEFQH